MTDTSDAAETHPNSSTDVSNEAVARSLGLVAPQHVVGWAQDGPDMDSVVAVVDISGQGFLETWIAGGNLTSSGLAYGVYGTLAFVTALRRDGQSVLNAEIRHGDELLYEVDLIPGPDGLVVWALDLDAHGEWLVDAAEQPSLTLRWLDETEL